MKSEIAVGRKEILELMHIESWRSIQTMKKRDEGFKMLFKVHPVNRKPLVIISEYIRWIVEFNKQ